MAAGRNDHERRTWHLAFEHDRLPRYLATKFSPHQVDLRDVLGLAELRGTLPAKTVALGLQPHRVELRNSLSDRLRCQVGTLADAVVQELAQRGYPADGFVAVPVNA